MIFDPEKKMYVKRLHITIIYYKNFVQFILEEPEKGVTDDDNDNDDRQHRAFIKQPWLLKTTLDYYLVGIQNTH